MDDDDDSLFLDENIKCFKSPQVPQIVREESQDLFAQPDSPSSPVLSQKRKSIPSVKRSGCFKKRSNGNETNSPKTENKFVKRLVLETENIQKQPFSPKPGLNLTTQNRLSFGDTQLTNATNARFGRSISGSTATPFPSRRGSGTFLSPGNVSILGNEVLSDSLINSESAFTIVREYTDVGPYFGLPQKVPELLKQLKNIEGLYAWQEECLKLAMQPSAKNLLYTLPTSGGKTLVAEILMMREVLCRRRNCLFVVPYVALVQEKVRSFSPFAVALDFIVEEYAGSQGIIPPKRRRKRRTIYISTIERANSVVNALIEQNRLEELGLVVLDEIHMISEVERGPRLESLVVKLKAAEVDTRLIGMTATVGNLNELAEFMTATVYRGDFRPVELKEYVRIGNDLWAVNKGKFVGEEDSLLNYERPLSVNYTDVQKRQDPESFGILVSEIVPQFNCLVFCATKRNAESIADLLSKVLPRSLIQHKAAEKRSLIDALTSESGGEICPILMRTLQFGVAYHHSGLTMDERRLIEEAYLAGTLCCLSCTSTLAAGVNLPAKRVILRAPYIGNEMISKARYQQMAGRAGRAGLTDIGEAILVIKQHELAKIKTLLTSPVEECISKYLEHDKKALKYLALSAASLGLASNTRELSSKVFSKTLLAVQSKALHVDIETLTISTVKDLISYGLLRQKKPDDNDVTIFSQQPLLYGDESLIGLTPLSQRSSSSLSFKSRSSSESQPIGFISDKPIDLDLDATLIISRLGKAAIRGSVDLERVVPVYQDLRQAQAGLVLVSRLHLMYLATPYEQVGLGICKIIPSQYLRMFNRLAPEEMTVARSLGVTEAALIKLISGAKPKVNEFVFERFYLTLMLHALWQGESIWDVAQAFESDRGRVQNLLQAAASFAFNLKNFCEEFDEFWAFVDLFDSFARQLSLCCTAELIPLMELPSVKRGRAKQLYKAGFRTLADVANAAPESLTRKVDQMPRKVAIQIIAAAKMLITEKAESLQEEAEDMLLGLTPSTRKLFS